jgi:DNA-binding PadR family transcriptional regulator
MVDSWRLPRELRERRPTMAIETETGHVALTKRRLLEYLSTQTAPVTAKVVSIDLDSRASTVTEMLERCAAQGLVGREDKRPREYRITEAGRERLRFWSNPSGSADESADPEEDDPERPEPVSASEVREAVDREMDKLREEMAASDLFELRNLPRLSGGGLRARAQQFKSKLESLAKESRERIEMKAIVALYQAQSELRSLGWLDSKEEVKARIAVLEGAIEKKTAEQVRRLVSLEKEAVSEADDLRAILELRETLHLSVSVLGRGPKSSEAAEE